MTEELVLHLRRFILSYGEHDDECPGNRATGPAAVDAELCTCGFIPRMEELLAVVAERMRDSP